MSDEDKWNQIAEVAGNALNNGTKKTMIRALLRVLLESQQQVRDLAAAPEQVATGEDASVVLPVQRAVRHIVQGSDYSVLGPGKLCISEGTHHSGRKAHVFNDGDTLIAYVGEAGLFFRRPVEMENRFEDVTE